MFHERLNSTRKSKGFTAQHMADSLAVTLRTYRNYESGDREPSLSALCHIADILGVTTDYLLCRGEALSGESRRDLPAGPTDQ